MIFDNNSIIKAKKIQLKLIEEVGLLEKNIEYIDKNIYYNCSKYKIEKNIEENFDNDSTNLSFFSTIQLNPLFSFHTLKKGYKNYINGNEITFYESICNDLDFIDINHNDYKKVQKEQNNIKEFGKNNNENIEDIIKKLLNKDINNI